MTTAPTAAQRAAAELDNRYCLCPGCQTAEDVASALRLTTIKVETGKITNLAEFLTELGQTANALGLETLESRRPDLANPSPPGFPARVATIKEAANHFNVHPDTIRRRVAAGELTAYRLGNRILRVDLDEAETLFRP
jgi:excisionase family DNA binding protein